jgi:hypothetical protein
MTRHGSDDARRGTTSVHQAARRRGNGVAARGARAASAGFLDVRKGSGWSNYFDAFVQRLQELGWIERKSVVIERRWAEGRSEVTPRLPPNSSASMWLSL